MVHRHLRVDGALGEQIRLALQFGLVLVVENFQRTEQKVCAVVRKDRFVGAGVDQPVLCREAVIDFIQFPLKCHNRFVGCAGQLRVDQGAGNVPQAEHPFDTVLSGHARLHRRHNTVLTVIHLSVHQRKGIVAHRRVCGNAVILQCFRLVCPLRQFGVKVRNRLVKQV